jgi:hypothetical protein
VIDLHAHVVLESLDGAAGRYGPELLDDPVCPTFRVGDYTLEGVRYRGSPFTDVSMRLDSMDALGIEWQMLSPNPLTQLHHVEVSTAAEFARRHNDELAGVVALHPSRLGGAAQLPVQAPDRAAAELRRAVGELGLVAAYMGTDIGHDEVLALDDPRMDELWSAAVELDVPVFLHPAPPGIDAPLADPRLRRFDADLWLAFAYEETLALATLGPLLEAMGARGAPLAGGGPRAPAPPQLRRPRRGGRRTSGPRRRRRRGPSGGRDQPGGLGPAAAAARTTPGRPAGRQLPSVAAQPALSPPGRTVSTRSGWRGARPARA